MAAPSWISSVSHVTLKDNMKTMIEMSQIGRGYWSSFEVGGTWPTSRYSGPLGCCTDSRYSQGGMCGVPMLLCSNQLRDRWASVPCPSRKSGNMPFDLNDQDRIRKDLGALRNVASSFLQDAMPLIDDVESDSLDFLFLLRQMQLQVLCWTGVNYELLVLLRKTLGARTSRWFLYKLGYRRHRCVFLGTSCHWRGSELSNPALVSNSLPSLHLD